MDRRVARVSVEGASGAVDLNQIMGRRIKAGRVVDDLVWGNGVDAGFKFLAIDENEQDIIGMGWLGHSLHSVDCLVRLSTPGLRLQVTKNAVRQNDIKCAPSTVVQGGFSRKGYGN